MPVKSVKKLDVMILAGGMGSRLKNSVSDRQKVVATVNGRPFLFFLLDQLQELAVNRLIFCTGHMHETVMLALKNYATNAQILFSREETPLGTGGAVRQAISLAESPDVLVMNGDSFIDCELKTFSNAYYSNNYKALMLLTSVDDVSRYGMVSIDNNQRITAFNEKGKNSGNGTINAGIYLLKKELLEEIPENCQYSLEKHFFPQLVRTGTLYGFTVNSNFIDIGTVESYSKADIFLNYSMKRR